MLQEFMTMSGTQHRNTTPETKPGGEPSWAFTIRMPRAHLAIDWPRWAISTQLKTETRLSAPNMKNPGIGEAVSGS